MTVIETARSTMTAYADAVVARGAFGKFLAPGVSLHVMGTDQQAHGRDEVVGLIRYLHEQAFDAHPQIKSLLVDGERAAIEADFVGRHIAEFAVSPRLGRRFAYRTASCTTWRASRSPRCAST